MNTEIRYLHPTPLVQCHLDETHPIPGIATIRPIEGRIPLVDVVGEADIQCEVVVEVMAVAHRHPEVGVGRLLHKDTELTADGWRRLWLGR